MAVEPVDPAASVLEHVDRPHFTQHAQVLGHLRLSQRERFDEIVHGVLARGQEIQDLPPPRLRHRV
jgi:hypothetical protein